ncbi:MAG: N-formylglutamate amidohydrolase [Clostridiales bacterium]|jgi:N-formylglutamate amidohydrolase|nr:N-formylglutamate amidohydrolase [Clostridiales bacterium]
MSERDSIVFHIPHSSVLIPDEYRRNIKLSDDELRREIAEVTDAYCDELFDFPFGASVVFGYSRLVCDVERFADDSLEPEAAHGHGMYYARTQNGAELRDILPDERERIERELYIPHHAALGNAVDAALERYGKCLIIDCHSFNHDALGNSPDALPDICVGADCFHTPQRLADAAIKECEACGRGAAVNYPYEGAIVPQSRYRADARVSSVMIEVNKKMYLAPRTMDKTDGFPDARGMALRLVEAVAAAFCA